MKRLFLCIFFFGLSVSVFGQEVAAQVTGSGTANTVPLWTTSTNLGNSLISQTSSGVKIATGIDATGTGIKHARSAGCTSGAAVYCNFTLTWPGSAFANTNYTVICATLAGYPVGIAKGTTSVSGSVTVYYEYQSSGEIDCIAIHD
jgi:hypothetical protein